VAAGLAPAAQGSDGGGSIRIPSSVCGLFGIKPTRGRVSYGPIVPDLDGLSVIGPIARTVADAALLLDVMAGNFPGDIYTPAPLPDGESFLGYAHKQPGRLRIARTLDHAIEGADVHPDCVAAYEEASSLLASLGHEVVDIPGPFGHDVVPFFETLWYSHATLVPLAPGQEDLLLPLTSYLRNRGLAVSATDLIFSQAYLQAVTRPALALPPRPVGWFDEVEPAENFERQKRFAPFPAVYNVSGQPAVSVPLHWTDEGLPIGVMLAGRMGGEGTLISLSAQLEQARPWKDRHPPIW
jgi:amidase